MDRNHMMACGMGHGPKKRRRFLYFSRPDEDGF